MSKEAQKSLGINRIKGIVRIFSRDNYSYIKITESEFSQLYNLNEFSNPKDEIEKTNTNNQLLETEILKKGFGEKKSLDLYIAKKSQVDGKLLNKMKNIKKQAMGKQKTTGNITNWF